MSETGGGKIGLWAVVAIGVGGMVGGGISAAASRVAVRVSRTAEERTIAKTVCRVLGLG